MRIYIVKYELLDFTSGDIIPIDPVNITENNESMTSVHDKSFVYCYDIGEDEYAIGGIPAYKLVVKKEDISDENVDAIMQLYNGNWLTFYYIDTENNKEIVKTNDRFALELLTTPRKSNTLFITHAGLHRIGKVTNKFILETVRHGSYESEVPPAHTVYWYTLRLPPVSEKNEIHILYTLLKALKYMYESKHVIYNKTHCIYNGMIDPYAFEFDFSEPRGILRFIIDKARNHDAFGDMYNDIKKVAEIAVDDDKELLFSIASILDIYNFINKIYHEYIDSYSTIMKEYFEAIFKGRIPEKSPIEVTIIDFESKYKKKIEQ